MSEYVIIGGTGTLGREVTKKILDKYPDASISIVSRDELKQQQMRRDFRIFDGLKFVLGDIRDRGAMASVVRGAGCVFIFAAIKHVDVAERNPLEALKTNVLGPVNVAEECLAQGVRYCVFSNTDKAVLPITTYGYTKAIAQSYLLSRNGVAETKFSVFNWGNIVASRGSVIPQFVESLKEKRRICVTDTRMSRFWISIEQAATFMLENYHKAPRDRALIPPIKGATVLRVAETIAKMMDIDDYAVDVFGMRGIEKLYEVLETSHDGCLRSDSCEQYSDEELKALIVPVLKDFAA